VPHSYIEVLNLYKFHPSIRSVLLNSMSHWNTVLSVDGEFMATIDNQLWHFSKQCTLFCIAMNLSSELNAATRYGYIVKS